MKTHLRVFAIVVFILVFGCGTASAYSKTTQSVVINLDGVPRMVSTKAEVVSELLDDISDTIDTEYILEDVSKTDAVTDMMTISLISVTEKVIASTEVIPFETEERTNSDLPYGETRVVQEGKDGMAAVIHKEIYHGKDLVDTKFVEEKEVTAPVTEIIEIGAGGFIDGMKYVSAFDMKVTAYTPFDAGCTGITATGTVAGRGTVAVDPRVIPLGTKVYVPGYGVAIAADTGGAIKGNRVDICVPTTNEAFSWGVRNVTVYVIE